MSKSDSGANSAGTIVSGMLGVAFVVLKLCGVINWSWWWVTAPFWGMLAIVIAILAVVEIVWLVRTIIAKAVKRG